MPVQSLLRFFADQTTLSPDFVSELETVLHVENYQPHQVFHAAGQTESRLWFLEKVLPGVIISTPRVKNIP